jgi:uncharacterized membrane protein YfcA
VPGVSRYVPVVDAAVSARLLVILATFFVAGIVKGVSGMGLPTIAMGVLAAFLPPAQAAALLIVPSFVTNVWQLAAGPNFASLITRLWLMMLAIVVGALASAGTLTSGSSEWTTRALGCALALYAGVSLLYRVVSVPARVERLLSPLIGLMTGLITGATGVFVIPAVPYLQSIGLSKDDLVQALGLSFTTSTVALALGLGWGGSLDSKNLLMSACAVLPALLGMWSGGGIRARLNPEAFRRGFLALLLLLGLELAVRSSHDETTSTGSVLPAPRTPRSARSRAPDKIQRSSDTPSSGCKPRDRVPASTRAPLPAHDDRDPRAEQRGRPPGSRGNRSARCPAHVRALRTRLHA